MTTTKAPDELVDELRSLNHFVTYDEARMLLSASEFAEFQEGCRVATKHARGEGVVPPGDATKIDRMGELRRIAASRKPVV